MTTTEFSLRHLRLEKCMSTPVLRALAAGSDVVLAENAGDRPPPTQLQLRCVRCEKPFLARRRTKKFCSRACQNRQHRDGGQVVGRSA